MVIDNFEGSAPITKGHNSMQIDSHEQRVVVASQSADDGDGRSSDPLLCSRRWFPADIFRALDVNVTAHFLVPSRTVVLNVLESLLTEVDNVIFKDAPFGFEKVLNVFCSEEECDVNERNTLCVICARLFVSFVIRIMIHFVTHVFVLCDTNHVVTSLEVLTHATALT